MSQNKTPSELFAKYAKQFYELSELEQGWDSYDAWPISKEAIMYAILFGLKCNLFLEPNLGIVPCVNGRIQMELHQAGYDLEWIIDDKGYIYGYYFCNQKIEEETTVHVSQEMPKLWHQRHHIQIKSNPPGTWKDLKGLVDLGGDALEDSRNWIEEENND